jgi:hypothetical protein
MTMKWETRLAVPDAPKEKATMKRWSVMAWAVSVAVLGVVAPGCNGGWETRNCADLIDGDTTLTTNGKTYEHQITCGSDGNCETSLKDDQGKVFFDCTDGQGQDCLSGVVDAEWAYCDVGPSGQ